MVPCTQFSLSPAQSTASTHISAKPNQTSCKRYSKVHPRTGNEGPEEEERHSSTPSLTSATPRPPVPIVKEAGWTPGTVWTDAENLTATGIRSPFRPSRSESLHGLRYPGPHQSSCSTCFQTACNNLPDFTVSFSKNFTAVKTSNPTRRTVRYLLPCHLFPETQQLYESNY